MLRMIWQTIANSRRARLVRAAFYQRKDPGVRLRLQLADANSDLTQIEKTLRDLRKAGKLSAYRSACYEPEQFLFGGAAAMAAVHAYFDHDSSQWLELYAQVMIGRLGIAPAVISLAQLSDLFGETLGQRHEEIWDVWCRLAEFHGMAPPLAPTEASTFAVPRLGRLAQLPNLPAEALDCLRTLASANRRLSARLRQLATQGRLEQGMRGVLAALALFHWNRIGLDAAQRQRLLQALRAHFHPHRAWVAAHQTADWRAYS